MLKFAAIAPHPPIIIPTIGQPEELKKAAKTVQAMEDLAEKFAAANPQTVIIVSPHGPVNYNEFIINSAPVLVGHFYNFGDFETELIFRNDEKLIAAIEKECKKAKILLEISALPKLDHGVLVPLYYLFKKLIPETGKINLLKNGRPIKVVPIIPSFADAKSQFQFGKILQQTICTGSTRANCGVVVSGDLSHRLTPEAPIGFSPQGKKFDEKIVELLEKKDVKGILQMQPSLIEQAGECGYRPIAILLGVLDGLNWQPEILSYEGPFGVGYLVANFKLNDLGFKIKDPAQISKKFAAGKTRSR